MNSILRDGKVAIGVAMVVEFAALFLVPIVYRGLAGQAAIVGAIGGVGVDILAAVLWLGLVVAVMWIVVGALRARRGTDRQAVGGAANDAVAEPSRLAETGRVVVAGYGAIGVVVALTQAKFIATHPIEWGDMAFLNLAARVVAEVVSWPWTVMAYFGG